MFSIRVSLIRFAPKTRLKRIRRVCGCGWGWGSYFIRFVDIYIDEGSRDGDCAREANGARGSDCGIDIDSANDGGSDGDSDEAYGRVYIFLFVYDIS